MGYFMARTYHVFDIVIVGAGTAGIAALREALKHTTNVVLVEKGDGGTTCARTGCMPSKALIHAARLYESRRRFASAGITGAEHLRPDISSILKEVRRKRDYYVNSVHEGLESIRHYIVQGEVKFESLTCLRVDGKLYHTRQTIIATGSMPFIPKAFADLPKKRIITSENLFEQKNLPQRIGFVGLGPLGLEMAQALAFLGHEIVAVHRGAQLGGISNPQINKDILQMLGKHMIVHTNADAAARMEGDHIVFSTGEREYEVDAVFLSAGRKPSLSGLGLRRLKVPLKDDGVPWYDPMTLQLPGLPVFLAGDVTDERAIMHEAALEGKIAAYNASRSLKLRKEQGSDGHRYSRYVPLNIIFTEPNIASVGASWEGLQGRDIIRVETSFENQGRAVLEQCNEGRIQLFLDSEDTTLLGAELLAPHGEHLAHLLALAIQQRLTAREMLRMPFYHPTFEEAVRTALKRGVRQAATA